MKTPAEIISLAHRHKALLSKSLSVQAIHLKNIPESFQRHEINAFHLLNIGTPVDLCQFFRKSFDELEQHINSPSYETYAIPKKKVGFREIDAPGNKLKSLQKRLNYFLQAYYLMIRPDVVFGFVIHPHYLGSYCNIAENARRHVRKKHLLNMDLKDFFPSIPAREVMKLFRSEFFAYNEQVAIALTMLTTYRGKLPVGAPTSPVIANFICYPLDRALESWCQQKKITYTRYADDLTFSSEVPFAEEDIREIVQIIHGNGFELNQKKFRLNSSGQKQTVTGLTVNTKVNVDRRLLKKIRAMLHDMTTNGIDAATQRHLKLNTIPEERQRAIFIHRLEGYINFVGQVRGKYDPLYIRQKASFDSLFNLKEIESLNQ